MVILVDQKTKALIQGITGKEGSRACREMRMAGTNVLAGVTPGKGGEHIEGVRVYDGVAEAMAHHPDINTSLITVPGLFVKDAAREAIAAGIPLIDILTEHVPVRDAAEIVAFARLRNVRVIGPSSVGIISPGKGKVGSIGSSQVERRVFMPGPVGIISKSGGMTAEIAAVLTHAGIGQSTAVGIGGDRIIATGYTELLGMFEEDRETRAVVLFGEVGGTYEEEAAVYIQSGRFTKPVVALIAGKFTQLLPHDTVLGHAGAIVARGRGGYTSKVRALARAGVKIAESIEDIPKLLRNHLAPPRRYKRKM